MSLTPVAAPIKSSPPQIKRKPSRVSKPNGVLPSRMLDAQFLQDDVTSEELGKVCYVTGLETGGRFVGTTRYNIRLNESDMIVEIEPESSALGHTVTWFSPFA